MTIYAKTISSPPNLHLIKDEFDTAVLPAVIEYVCFDGLTTIYITTDVSLDSTQEAALDTAITNHDPEPLDKLKIRLSRQIFSHYNALNKLGFTHGSVTLIGNANAIAHIGVAKHQPTQHDGQKLPTVNGTSYTVVDSTDLNTLFDACRDFAGQALANYAAALNDITIAPDKTAAQTAHDIYAGA